MLAISERQRRATRGGASGPVEQVVQGRTRAERTARCRGGSGSFVLASDVEPARASGRVGSVDPFGRDEGAINDPKMTSDGDATETKRRHILYLSGLRNLLPAAAARPGMIRSSA